MVAVFDAFLDTAGAVDAPGTNTDTDPLGPPNVRFKRADNPTIDLVNPMTIPASGTNRSRWKSLYLKNATAPETQVDNVKIFSDGAGFGTGITVNAGNETPTKNSASDAGYDVSNVDDEVLTNHVDITAITDFFTFTSGAPKSVSISEAGGIIDAVGETTNYVVIQMETINTANPGDLADETVTWEYDEI